MKEVYLAIHTNSRTGHRRIFAFSTEDRVKRFIAIQKARHKRKHGLISYGWKYQCIAVDAALGE